MASEEAREKLQKLQVLAAEIAAAISSDVSRSVGGELGGETGTARVKKCDSGFYCGKYNCTPPFSCSDYSCSSKFTFGLTAGPIEPFSP